MTLFSAGNLDYPVYWFRFNDDSLEDDGSFFLVAPSLAGTSVISSEIGLTGNTDPDSFEAKVVAAIITVLNANTTGGLLSAELLQAPEIATNVAPA